MTARTLLPLVARDLWFTGEAAAEGTIERQRRRALDLLAEWNGEMNEHLPEPLIYMAWMRELQDLYQAARQIYSESLSTVETCGRGWSRRVTETTDSAV